MLECATCPSVIVECGFLSNPQEDVLLQDEKHQKKLAKAIADGIEQYFKDMAVQ